MFTRIRLPFGRVKECCYMGVSPEVDGSGLDVSDPAVDVPSPCGYVLVDLLSIMALGKSLLPIYPIQLVVQKTQ